MEEMIYNRINMDLPATSHPIQKKLIDSGFFFVANSCGYFSKPVSVFHPRAEVDHYMIYVTEGLLEVTLGETTKYLHTGNLLILPPATLFEFQAAGRISFYWLHFTGSHAELLMENCDIHPNIVYHLPQLEDFSAHFQCLFQLFEQFFQDNDLVLLDTLAPVHFLKMLADIRCSTRVTDPLYVTDANIQNALRYLRRNFSSPISMEALASMHNLSPSYFRTVFKKHTGSSPIDYLIELRLNSAVQLLLYSTLSIQEISERSGFLSQAYFSRVFRQKFGLTPSAYRKIGFAKQKDVQLSKEE